MSKLWLVGCVWLGSAQHILWLLPALHHHSDGSPPGPLHTHCSATTKHQGVTGTVQAKTRARGSKISDKHHMKSALKGMPLVSLCWPTISEANVGGTNLSTNILLRFLAL